jgi:hypothetical protein
VINLNLTYVGTWNNEAVNAVKRDRAKHFFQPARFSVAPLINGEQRQEHYD